MYGCKELYRGHHGKACYRYASNPTKQVSIRLKIILVILLFTWLLACVVPIPQWIFSTLQREASGMICVQAVPVDAHDFMSVYVKAYPLLAYCTPLSFAILYFGRHMDYASAGPVRPRTYGRRSDPANSHWCCLAWRWPWPPCGYHNGCPGFGCGMP